VSDYERRANSTAQCIAFPLKLVSGAPALGLTASDILANYYKQNFGFSGIALVDIGFNNSPWVDGGFGEITQSSFAPGLYRLDLSDVVLSRADVGNGIVGPDVTLCITGPTITPAYFVIALTDPFVLADMRMINGVFINGAGVEDDEFQP